jgi:integrase/recombinase XerD
MLADLIRQYLDDLAVHHYSPRTIRTRRRNLEAFRAWCDTRDLREAQQLTRDHCEAYQRALFHHRTAADRPLSIQAQRLRLVELRGFGKWLARRRHLAYNPAGDLTMPRTERLLPHHVLSVTEVEAVLARPDLDTWDGLRDRALLEVLYSTGIRRCELARLELADLDFERGVLAVRLGKGKKDRVVPIGQRALDWVSRYLRDVRPTLPAAPTQPALFLNITGGPLGIEYLTHRVRAYLDAAGIAKKGACHLFRHTMATLMLDRGADLRHVQEMLGHARLETTQIYTHVAIQKLKDVHTATHPGAQDTPGAAARLAADLSGAPPPAPAGATAPTSPPPAAQPRP